MLGVRRHVIVPCMFLDFMHTLWRIRRCFGGNQNAPKTKRWQIVQQTVITFRILTPKQINMTRNFIWKRYSGWLTMGEGRVTEQASTLCQHLACRWGQYCLYLYIVQFNMYSNWFENASGIRPRNSYFRNENCNLGLLLHLYHKTLEKKARICYF